MKVNQSIIIPSYKEKKNLPKLLKIIKNQERYNYKIIIADVNSKDKTTKITKPFKCRIVERDLPKERRSKFILKMLFFWSRKFFKEIERSKIKYDLKIR